VDVTSSAAYNRMTPIWPGEQGNRRGGEAAPWDADTASQEARCVGGAWSVFSSLNSYCC